MSKTTKTRPIPLQHRLFSIHRSEGGLPIADESHIVKNAGKGPWRILLDMKMERPGHRFWFATSSGKIINSNPTDIAGPMDIISSAELTAIAETFSTAFSEDGKNVFRRATSKHLVIYTEAF